jgi:hypothetical protein
MRLIAASLMTKKLLNIRSKRWYLRYSTRHQIAWSKGTEGLCPPYRAALSQQYSVASFATVRVLSCLHSPGLRCSFCNVEWFFCDLEACNLVTAAIAWQEKVRCNQMEHENWTAHDVTFDPTFVLIWNSIPRTKCQNSYHYTVSETPIPKLKIT